MTRTATLLLVLALAAPAVAQPARSQARQPNRAPATDQMSPGQLHQLFDAMLVMQAQNVLELSDDQYAQFVARVKRLQDVRRRAQQQRLRALNDLQRLVRGRADTTPAESDVVSRLDALRELEAQSARDLQEAYASVDEILNPLQQARFRVLEDQLERRKLELVGRARGPRQQRR